MKFTDIIECSELIEAFGTMEILVLNTKHQLTCESSMNTISYEQLNDLKSDLLNITEAVKAYPREYMDTNRIISEGFVKISKARRTNSDISIFESALDDMLIEFVNKRKSIVYEGDIEFESFNSNLQDIYDHYISETTNIEVGNDISFTGLLEGIGNVLSNIKNAFGSKHDKLVARDQKWLKDNKKKLLSLDYTNIELEVPSDYKVTFASLINHHDIFDKNFKGDSPSADKIARFKDKSGNLKNGLDNYYRTGSSRREIGLRKVSGNEAKTVVKAMIEYCNDFLSGKKYIDEKLDSISKEVEDEEPVKESMEILSESTVVFSSTISASLKELDNLYNEIIEKGYKSPILLNRQFGLMRIAVKESVKNAKTKKDLDVVNKEVMKSVSNIIELSKKDPVIREYLSKDDKHKKWMKFKYVELFKEREQEIQEGKETSITESTLIDSGLVFVSEENFNDGKVLYPRIPKNFLVDNGYEDDKTPRICFSTSIDKALTALSSNLKGKELFVYKPINIDDKYIIRPTIEQVPDSGITDEVWYTKTVKVKCVKKIRVIEAGDEEYYYRYGNKTATLYNWIWEEVYSITESIIYEAGEDTSKNNEDDDDLGLEDDPIDDIDTEGDEKEPKEEKKTEDVKKDTEEAVDDNNLARDRQTGITVLMTIAEERYFDYIDILTSLVK